MDAKYDKIGTGYNITRQADPYITERLLYLLQPKSSHLYLDIGCGTGNYTVALANKGFKFTGVDPSEKMLTYAKKRNPDLHWLNGTAEQIPANHSVFDGIIAVLTIHHWTDIKKAFIEIHRVLSNNGRFVLFTSTPEQMKSYWLNHYFPQMLQASIIQMPALDEIRNAIEEAGLNIRKVEKYYIQDDLHDCFLYVGKNKPERYFDEQIRRGISSFTSLANNEEVKQGLSKLKNDIETKSFEKIKADYDNDLGDYLFVAIDKTCMN